MRWFRSTLIVLLGAVCLLTVSPPFLWAGLGKGSPAPDTRLSHSWKNKSANLFWTRLYWQDGLHIDGHYEKFKFRIGGAIMVDGGTLRAGRNIKNTFPNFEGKSSNLRKLTLELNGVFFDTIETKLQIDFAHFNEVKDNWVRFLNIPVLNRFKFGNMKEPFSLEAQASSKNLIFMERALPTMAFSPGRNIGVRYDDLAYEGRLSWAVGAFMSTGSFSNMGTTTDRMEERNGWNLTGRITYLLRASKKGRTSMHLGLSYTHQFREKGGNENDIKFSALPESYLASTRLVDTGKFSVKNVDIFDTEIACISGPLSIQGECFNAFVDTSEGSNPHFWGFYVYGSYFLTGESRPYDRTHGVFTKVSPAHPFHPLKNQWGALELALRCSYIDLSNAGIRGGRERNLSAGLNWYLYPKTRMMFNYIQTKLLENGTQQGRNGHADIFMVRFQFGF